MTKKSNHPYIVQIIKLILAYYQNRYGNTNEAATTAEEMSLDHILGEIKPRDRLRALLTPDEVDQSTVLHIACEHGDLAIVRYVLEALLYVNDVAALLTAADQHGDTPLHVAARNDRVNVLLKLVKFLVRAPRCKAAGVLTRLAGKISSKSADCDVEKILLQTNHYGETVLHCASEFNTATVISALLQAVPASTLSKLLKRGDVSGRTPLHYATRNCRHSEVQSVLLRFICSSYERPDMEEIIFSHDKDCPTFLHMSVRLSSSPVITKILDTLCSDITLRLLSVSDGEGITPLSRAVENKRDPDIIMTILQFIVRQSDRITISRLLMAEDVRGWTFLHRIAFCGSAETLQDILSVLPRRTALKLSLAEDMLGMTAHDQASSRLKRDILNQAGCYPLSAYSLTKPPTVIIFYRTKNRQAPIAADGEQTDADAEKDCVENYFRERSFPCSVKKDPTGDEIFSTISDAQTDDDLSGLIVFVMSHGEKGVVTVEGDPGFVMIQDIIAHMCCYTEGKPKALVIQACQMRDSQPLRHPSSRLDPMPGRLSALTRQGAMLKYHPDFLLYQATVSGSYAFRHVMIPCLVESLKQLEASDSVIRACELANYRVRQELERLDPNCTVGQLPKLESTLSKKFCIGKRFPAADSD